MKSAPGYSNGVRQKVSKAVTEEERERPDCVVQFRKISNGWIKHESWKEKSGLQTRETFIDKDPQNDQD